MKPISLGRDYDSCCCSPVKSPEKSVYYPETYFTAKQDADLPKAGRITFEFVRTRKSVNDKDGTVDYGIELRQVVDVSTKAGSMDSNLDDARDEVMAESDGDDE